MPTYLLRIECANELVGVYERLQRITFPGWEMLRPNANKLRWVSRTSILTMAYTLRQEHPVFAYSRKDPAYQSFLARHWPSARPSALLILFRQTPLVAVEHFRTILCAHQLSVSEVVKSQRDGRVDRAFDEDYQSVMCGRQPPLGAAPYRIRVLKQHPEKCRCRSCAQQPNYRHHLDEVGFVRQSFDTPEAAVRWAEKQMHRTIHRCEAERGWVSESLSNITGRCIQIVSESEWLTTRPVVTL